MPAKPHISMLIAIAAVAAMALPACKTTEANYRAAYEKTVARQNEAFDPAELREISREEAMPKTVYHGDSIPLKGEYVRPVEENGTTPQVLRYNIVTASFTQRFNALSALKRIRDNGYPGAILLTNGKKQFIVDAFTTNDLDSAVAVYRRMAANPPYQLQSPYPYILKKP